MALRLEGAPAKRANGTSPSPWPNFLAGQAEKPVRVLLVDDGATARRVIAHELVMEPRVCFVGEAGSMAEGKRLLARHEFDVLILEVKLGGG